ncbi:MAG: hypothetical protein CMLOHMNK_00453 [Steroidobacteraceae bacterium]|nr:hypothetical protein [Steroidobacteraceae bacterium]
MSNVKHSMPNLARHEGVWDGHYRYYDASGNKTDEHRSRLICRFTDDAQHPYHQTNHYSWADGKKEVRDFVTRYQFGRIIFDNDLIYGWCSEIPEDDLHRTLMLYWLRRGTEGMELYEMIQLSDCGQYRNRVWHWFQRGRLIQRTLIDEQRVTDQWRHIKGESFAGDPV